MSKLIIILAFLGLALATLTTNYLSKSKLKPVSHAAIKVVLNQTTDYRLSLKKLSGESSYTPDYKLTIPYGYYRVLIINENGKELFSGKVEKNKVTFPPYQMEEQKEGDEPKLTFEPLKELSLLLPYFTDAKKIIFLDEDNQLKFELDVGDVGLPNDYSKNLCGNGICDSGENFIFCYSDCRRR